MTTSLALRLAGLAAVVSGVLFALMQAIHPAAELANVTTDAWYTVHLLNVLFPIFGMLGLVGIYARQLTQSGWLGLGSFLLMFSAFAMMLGFGFYEAFMEPVYASVAPDTVMDILGVVEGETGPGLITEVYAINGAMYMIGGVLLAVSLFLAKVFPRWMAVAVFAGIALTLSSAALPVLERPSAVVFGLAFAVLGGFLMARPVDIAPEKTFVAAAT